MPQVLTSPWLNSNATWECISITQKLQFSCDKCAWLSIEQVLMALQRATCVVGPERLTVGVFAFTHAHSLTFPGAAIKLFLARWVGARTCSAVKRKCHAWSGSAALFKTAFCYQLSGRESFNQMKILNQKSIRTSTLRLRFINRTGQKKFWIRIVFRIQEPWIQEPWIWILIQMATKI